MCACQHSNLHACLLCVPLKVKEALLTSALLRLPRSVSMDDKRKTVQSVLEVLVRGYALM